MTAPAPSWAMAAQALDARDQVHLRTGLHLRVMTAPVLGLPVTPLRILARRPGTIPSTQLRRDVMWTDGNYRILVPPFDVSPDRPVLGWLPTAANALIGSTQPPATCCWFEAEIDSGADLRLAALAPTARGPQPVASSTSRPHQVWASSIGQVRLTGPGTVRGASWLPASLDGELLKLTALPVDRPQARYAALDRGVLLAAARVARGAPQRRALYDVDGAPQPADAPALAVAAEVARVAVLSAQLAPDVRRLVAEPVLPPWLLATVADMFDERGVVIGSATSNCLETVLQATADHGLARWLGFLDVDDLTSGADGIGARVVTAVFAPDWDQLRSRGLMASIPPEAIVADLAALRAEYPDFEALGDLAGTVDGPYLDLGVTAAYTAGRMLAGPEPPQLVSVTDDPQRTADVLPSATSAWLPVVPPAAERSTRVQLGGLVAGATVALQRGARNAVGPVVLNAQSAAATFHQPIVGAPAADVTATVDAADPRSSPVTTVDDRHCPAEPVRYHVAQADWFGRWSDFARIDLAAGRRPLPPRPVLRLSYAQPVPNADAPDGPLAGAITITVAMPAPDELPPGAQLLRNLRIEASAGGGTPAVSRHAIVDPTAPPAELVITLAGPVLERGLSTTTTVTGYWVDADGDRSLAAQPATLTLWDPRPPPPVVMAVEPPLALRYSSRPDVTGRAIVSLTWSAASPQDRFRVYAADETTLRARLATVVTDPQVAALLAAVDGAPDAVHRAEVWRDGQALLPRNAFTSVTPAPIERVTSTVAVEHAVSGSLRTLMLYRVVAISGANVEADFGDSPLVPFGVPNTLPPPQPQLAVRVLDPSTTGLPTPLAELTVRVPRGSARAVEYRLRRSRVVADEPMLMPIVGTGVLHPPSDGDVHAEIVIDAGPTTIEPTGVLRPWNRYTWRIEVRGLSEPGGGPPGMWSQPSAAVGCGIVPLAEPASPEITGVRRRAGTVEVAVAALDSARADLRGGVFGTHVVELYRQQPGEHERLLDVQIESDRPGPGAPFRFADNSSDPPVAHTRYRAAVVDPLGRRSAPSAARPSTTGGAS